MKKIALPIFLSLAFLFGYNFLFAQNTPDTTVIYYDAMWKPAKAQNSIFYISKQWSQNSIYYQYDFYYPSLKPQMMGSFSDPERKKKEGSFIYYYENGIKKDSGRYVQNKPDGYYYGWYDSGQQNYKRHYTSGILTDTSVDWYKSGQQSSLTINDKNGNGIQEQYDDDGKIRVTGHFVAGKKQGIWVFTDKNRIISQKVVYEADSAMSINNYNEKGVEEEGVTENGKKLVEKAATFPGGLNGWRRFLERNLQYPTAAQRNKIQGVIRVQLIIAKDGSVTDYKVLGNPDKDLAQEALRMMNISPKWIPATQYNRPVTYRFVQTITFQLQ